MVQWALLFSPKIPRGVLEEDTVKSWCAVAFVVVLGLGVFGAELATESLLAVLEKEVAKKSNLGTKKFPIVYVEESIPANIFESFQETAALAGRLLGSREGVAVVYMVADDNLFKSWIKGGIRLDIVEADHAAFTRFPELDHLLLLVTFPMMDKYGNQKLTIVAMQYLHRETYRKINWELGTAMVAQLIEKAADFFWWNPEF